MMSGEEASNLVREMHKVRSTRSEPSLCSRRSRTSKRSLTKSHLSVKSESLSLRKAALQAKQLFKDDQKELLLEEVEAEQRRLTLRQQQQQIALQQEQEELKKKVLERKKADLADRLEMAEIDAQLEVLEEMSEHDSEISFKELTEEKKSEGIQRFFDSQEKIPTPPLRPDIHVASSSNPRMPAGWDRIAASMEGCLTKLTQVAMDQSVASNQLAASSQLPSIDVPIFSGDPLGYIIWRNAFNCLVDSKPISNAKKLNYLNAYVSGKPKEIVEHHLLIGADDAYQEARRQLDERFGNPSTVGVSYSQKLYAWPKITNRDATGLRDFSDFLLKICMAKRHVHSLGILDFPQENVKLVEKLPNHLEGKWREQVEIWQRSKGTQSYPSFSAFADFVKRAADRANIPELEPLSISRESRPGLPESRNPHRTKARIFATNGRSHEASSQQTEHVTYPSCPFCNGDHHIDACEKFMEMSMEERKSFFFQKMLCFGCALTDKHRGKDCTKKKVCDICHGRHLTCLHEDR